MVQFVESRAITLDAADRVVDAALAKAGELGLPVSVAVVDLGGRLMAFARAEGAPPVTTGVAHGKARTVVLAGGAPTHLLSEMVKDDMALLLALSESGGLTLLPGGQPVLSEAHLIGAAGVSGGTAEQDREIAEVAVAVVS